jgi:opacity protein-like surface antigen
VVVAVAAVLCTPTRAHADAYISPWAGVHFGNSEASGGLRSFGVSVGEAGNGPIGIETNLSFAPGFFEDDSDNYELDFMAGVTIGPTLNASGKSTRPYVVGELGMIRTSIESNTNGGRFVRSDFGMAVGAGVMHDLTERIRFRGDLRYLRSLNSDNAANSLGVDVGNFQFWRLAFGIVLH